MGLDTTITCHENPCCVHLLCDMLSSPQKYDVVYWNWSLDSCLDLSDYLRYIFLLNIS